MSRRVLVDHARAGADGERLGRLAARLSRRYLAELAVDDVELSIALTDDRRIRALKKQWLGRDEATDVLSFPALDDLAPGGVRSLGDIVVSVPWTRRAARRLATTVDAELARYLAHGLLHLLGFDHHRPADERQMRRLEDRLVHGAGMLSRARSVLDPA